jgi:hypothetical protein
MLGRRRLMHAKSGAARGCKNTSTRMQICRREAADLCKSGKPFLHREPPLLKNRNYKTGDF